MKTKKCSDKMLSSVSIEPLDRLIPSPTLSFMSYLGMYYFKPLFMHLLKFFSLDDLVGINRV